MQSTNCEKEKAKARLETLLLDGLKSEETELLPGDWAAIRRVGMARLATNRAKK